MSLLWLLLAVDTAPVCTEPASLDGVRETVASVGTAAAARDVDAFRPGYTTLQAQVGCLDEILYPADAASLHAARYLHEALEGDRPAMAQSLLAATTTPGAPPPVWLTIPPGAEVADATPWSSVTVPEHTVLFVDGLPVAARPTDRPALYQGVGAGGEVLWTAWLAGDEALPEGFVVTSAPVIPGDGQERLEQVTALLAEGEYEQVVALAVPAASAYPDLEQAFRAAADLAVDQMERTRDRPLTGANYEEFDPYAPRPRRGAMRRGDDRSGFLLGFEVGAPTAVRGEWKIGGTAVDGVGVRVGGNLMFESASSTIPVLDSQVYADWNLTPKWQLETGLGLFFDPYTSPYVNVGGAVQYDPPSPFQVNVGMRVSSFGYVAPDVTVGFLW